jgi:dephospho-CoA kinase
VHLFGLTGGIASGKSAVAAHLRARGVPVIDADQLSREVVVPGSPGLEEIVKRFGRQILLPSGELDRKGLAQIMFDDPEQRLIVNAIVHPRVTALTLERASELRERGEPLACYEAALIIENKVADAFRPLVVVSVPEDVQIARATARDAHSAEHIKARIRAQVPLAEKLAVADFVIENTGTLDDLHRRTDEVLAAICKRVGVDAARYNAVS